MTENIDFANVCKIPVARDLCEDKKIKCSDCPYKSLCDCYWVSELWQSENKQFGKNSLLGPYNPAFIKPDFRNNHVISITKSLDFCCYNNPKSKSYVVIGDIYVDEKLRGQGIAKQLIFGLMKYYDKDVFAKCVRGSSAEEFWKHLGEQIPAAKNAVDYDLYEHRPNKRDLGWYLVKNKFSSTYKTNLF